MVLLAVALVLAQTPQTLALRLEVGDTWTTEMREQFSNKREEFEETDVWREEYRVLKVEAVGATVAFTRTFQYTLIGDDKIPPAKGTTPETGQRLLHREGGWSQSAPTEISTKDLRLLRLDSLGVRFPEGSIPVGYQWGIDWPRLGPIPDAKASWRLDAVVELAGRKVAAVSFRVVENPTFDFPMEAEGARWVDLVSGVILEEQGTTKNYPVPGGDFRIDRTLSRKLLKVSMPRATTVNPPRDSDIARLR